MGVLADTRAELAATLAPLDLTVYAHLPAQAVLPSAIILPGSPYVEQGQAYGERYVHYEVWVSVPKGSNESESRFSDELTDQTVEALTADHWTVEGVSKPFEFEINNGAFLTTAITVTTGVTITN